MRAPRRIGAPACDTPVPPGAPSYFLEMERQVLEPELNMLRIPYEIINDPSKLQKSIAGAKVAAREYGTPIALLLSGDFLS